MLNNRPYWILFIIPYWLLCSEIYAANQLSKAKLQLARLSKEIRHTENRLNQAKRKQASLQVQLKGQDKTIGQLLIQKERLNRRIKQNNEAMIKLDQQIKLLTGQIQKEKKALSLHIYSRYTVDAHQPLKWLLSPGSKHELSQMLTYYQYLIQAQQENIQSITIKTKTLNNKKDEFATRLIQDKKMRARLANKQSALVSSKRKQQHIIQQLNQTITSNSQKLKEFQQNQIGLGRILAQLTKQDRISQSKPFAKRRNQLPRPVAVTVKAIKPIHQGLEFFAQEGAAVKAIHPGKILFSDWLKGYGLLLIIDHGHGYMTLYAHNQALTKQKGDWVEGGEKIAEVGHSGGLRENGLYFEIRHRGKAISPINWLS